MTRKPAAKPDDPAQYQRFLDMAKEVEADESPDAMDRAFDKVVGTPHAAKGKEPRKSPSRRR